MLDERLGDYLERLGSREPTPGGGSAACLCGALAASLGRMVLDVAASKDSTPERLRLLATFGERRAEFVRLASDDERAFGRVMRAWRLPKADATRAEQLQTALEEASGPPLHTAELARAVLQDLVEAARHASPSIGSDVAVAAHLALAALRSSVLNVHINLRSLSNAERRTAPSARCAALLEEGIQTCDVIVRSVNLLIGLP